MKKQDVEWGCQRSSKKTDGAKTAANDPCADLCLHKSIIRIVSSTIANLAELSFQLFLTPKQVMAPTRTKKPRSSTGTSSTAPPQTVALQLPARTPIHSPQKRSMTITDGQKQALIDNLQLESEHFPSHSMTQVLTSSQSRNARESYELNTPSKLKVYGLESDCG